MTRRSKIWLAVASVFTLINLGGAVAAAAGREGLHAGVHVVLMVVGAYVVWRLAPRSGQQDQSGAKEMDARLETLQQSVDAIALEAERMGEAQRFMTKLAAERAESAPPKPGP